MKDGGESPERGGQSIVARALRDNLAPLQRTADELQQAYADLVAASVSADPGNAIPALLRAQTAASSLASGLTVLSNFLVVAVKPLGQADGRFMASQAATAVAEPEEAEETPESVRQVPAAQAPRHRVPVIEEIPAEKSAAPAYTEELPLEPQREVQHAEEFSVPAAEPEEALAPVESAEPQTAAQSETVAPAEPEAVFDLSSFPAEIQDLHRRANRVAKVAMQDIKLLRPKDVQLGREHKDLCDRLRSDLDKARKEYDRRFRAIQDHPVDYFHRWVVEILAEGNEEALGDYPYPSPVLRH